MTCPLIPPLTARAIVLSVLLPTPPTQTRHCPLLRWPTTQLLNKNPHGMLTISHMTGARRTSGRHGDILYRSGGSTDSAPGWRTPRGERGLSQSTVWPPFLPRRSIGQSIVRCLFLTTNEFADTLIHQAERERCHLALRATATCHHPSYHLFHSRA